MYSSSTIENWEDYPENLGSQRFGFYRYNLSSYNQQLKDDSTRLFVSEKEKIAIKTINIGATVVENVLDTRSALDDYLEKQDMDSGVRLIIIPQQSSWGRLVVDEMSTRKILSKFEIFPPFVDIIRSFGQQTGFEDDSSGGLYLRRNDQDEIKEACYLVKRVERHGRPESSDPWSIRQTGICHRRSGSCGHTFIILNPSICLRRLLRGLQEYADSLSPQDLHAMFLSCGMENWRWYISDLEKRYIEMKRKAQLVRVDRKGESVEPGTDVCIEDIQDIHVLQDKCQQLAHALDLNSTVLHGLCHQLEATLPVDELQVPTGTHSLHSLTNEMGVHVKRVDRLLGKLDGTIALTRTVLDFCCIASLRNNSRMMMTITRLAQEDNNRMRELTEKATRDTDAMKCLTLLALIYLPASLASSMMGMNYIKVYSGRHGLALHFEEGFWAFFVLTFLFLTFTMALYLWYIRRRQKHGGKDTESKCFEKIDS